MAYNLDVCHRQGRRAVLMQQCRGLVAEILIVKKG